MCHVQFAGQCVACSVLVLHVESSVECEKYSELENLTRTKVTAFLKSTFVGVGEYCLP